MVCNFVVGLLLCTATVKHGCSLLDVVMMLSFFMNNIKTISILKHSNNKHDNIHIFI